MGKRKGEENGTKKLCAFCLSHGGVMNIDSIHSHDGISAHYFCLLFGSGLWQRGTEVEGIQGFLVSDIKKEIRRGSKLKCVHCHKKGATVGCTEARCKKSFHLNCGIKHDALLQFFDQFNSYCKDHRVIQKPEDRSSSGEKATCSICKECLVRKPSVNNLWSPCCLSFYHRDCVQEMAISAGRHHFRCPLCNNRTDFLQEMRLVGIYVPEKDASWETVEDRNDIEPEVSCQAKICFCDRQGGRSTNQDDGLWEVLMCSACGSRGIHAKCCGMEDIPDPVWHCYLCRSVMRNAGNEDNYLVHTSKLLQTKLSTSDQIKTYQTRLFPKVRSRNLQTDIMEGSLTDNYEVLNRDDTVTDIMEGSITDNYEVINRNDTITDIMKGSVTDNYEVLNMDDMLTDIMDGSITDNYEALHRENTISSYASTSGIQKSRRKKVRRL